MEKFELALLSVILCNIMLHLIDGKHVIDTTGLVIKIDYSQILLENEKVNVECLYTSTGSYNITWRIYDPEKKIEPILSHGPDALVSETTKNDLNHIAFVFVARSDLQYFYVECAIKEIEKRVFYRIPRIQRLTVQSIHCERPRLVMNQANEVICFTEGGVGASNLTLIYYDEARELKQVAVKRIGKLTTFEEPIHFFEIKNIGRSMNNTPYHCITNSIGSDGRNLTIFSKVDSFLVHFMEFLQVPKKCFGSLNYSTLINIKVAVNPYPSASDFEMLYTNMENLSPVVQVFRPEYIVITESKGSTHRIELSFTLTTTGNYSIQFRDSSMHNLEVTSRMINVHILEIRTLEQSLHQTILEGDQLSLLLFLEATMVPPANHLFFYRENPLGKHDRSKDERIKEKYVTYKMNTLAGVCKIEVGLIPKKTGIYRFEFLLETSRITGPRFSITVKKGYRPKDESRNSLYLILLLAILVPIGSVLLGLLIGVGVKNALKAFRHTDSS